jgi:hypothetical protein
MVAGFARNPQEENRRWCEIGDLPVGGGGLPGARSLDLEILRDTKIGGGERVEGRSRGLGGSDPRIRWSAVRTRAGWVL